MSRLTRLENAHRALAAQHTALLEFCRAFLPLIQASPEAVQRALAEARLHCDEGIALAAMDAEYQAAVGKWLRILSDEVTVGCIPPRR